MLLTSCGGGDVTTSPYGVDETTALEETEPVVRVDHSIAVKEDAYVLNKNSSVDQSNNNFGFDTEIHIKSNGTSLQRFGYVKFDISYLVGDNDFTSIELNLTLTGRQKDPGNPEFATVSVYGSDVDWKEDKITYNSRPSNFGLITKLTDVSVDKVTRSYPVTDYIRKALAAGQTEVSFALIDETPELPLHIKLASKESGANAPSLEVSYSKVDDTKYEGKISTEPQLSNNGIDTILGLNKAQQIEIKAAEDTYVEGAEYADKVLGKKDVMYVKAMENPSGSLHRIAYIKF